MSLQTDDGGTSWLRCMRSAYPAFRQIGSSVDDMGEADRECCAARKTSSLFVKGLYLSEETGSICFLRRAQSNLPRSHKNDEFLRKGPQNSMPQNTVPGSYKYQEKISAIPNCPSNATAPFQPLAYHAVRTNPPSTSDFLPKGLDQKRAQTTPSARHCELWALSMFENADQLKEMVLRIEKRVPKFRLKVGEYCACLKLTDAHGKRTVSNHRGHFSFYEYESYDVHGAVVSIAPLFP